MARGERLVWCGPNSLEVIVTIHAARKAGLVAVPLSYRFNADEMQYVIDNSDATLVVVDAEQAPLVASVRDRLPEGRARSWCTAATCPPVAWRGTTCCADQSEDEPVLAAKERARPVSARR